MDVYISWSGKTSGELAKALGDWLPSVIQAVKPFCSEEDIEKGSRGNRIMDEELEKADIGLLCLTRDNLEAPWIMFEAGSLSKRLDMSRVCPILFQGLQKTDLKATLSNFQASLFNKGEMKKVVGMLNNQLGEDKLKSTVLDDVFDKFWPDLDRNVKTILSKSYKTAPKKIRDQRDILEEIITLCRSAVQFLQPKEKVIPMGIIKKYGTLEGARIRGVAKRLLADGWSKEDTIKLLVEHLAVTKHQASEIVGAIELFVKPKRKSEKEKTPLTDASESIE